MFDIVFYNEGKIHSQYPLTMRREEDDSKNNSAPYLNPHFEDIWQKANFAFIQANQERELKQNAVQPLNTEPQITEAFKKSSMSLLADRYKPSSFHDLIGNDVINREILRWFKGWRDYKSNSIQTLEALKNMGIDHTNKIPGNEPSFLQPALFWGAPGTGKTTFAKTLAKIFNYEPFVINASDERNGPELYQKVKNVYSFQSITESVQMTAKPNNLNDGKTWDQKQTSWNKKTLIILDEVDGVINSENNSAIHYLLSKIIDPKTKRCLIALPIIFICNNIYIKGLKELRSAAKTFLFKKDEESVYCRVKEILAQEKLYIDDKSLKAISQNFCFDIRSIFNYLELFLRKNSYDADELLKNLTAYDDERKSYFDIMNSLFLSSGKQRINFYYTDDNLFDGVFVNFLKADKMSNLKSIDRCLLEFMKNDITQTMIKSQGGIGYINQKHGYTIVRYILNFVKQKRFFSIEFPLAMINYRKQRKEKCEILKCLFEELTFPRRKRQKYIEIFFKMLHINVKNAHMLLHEKRALITAIKLMILLGLQITTRDKNSLLIEENPQKTHSASFFRKDKWQDTSVIFTPDIKQLFEYQGLKYPLKLSEQSVILINTKYQLVKNVPSNLIDSKMETDDSSDAFFNITHKISKKLAPSMQNSMIKYVYHDPSENGVEYPLKFAFFKI